MRAYDLRYEPPERSYGWMAELHPSTCLVIGTVPDSERDQVQAIAGDVREKPTSALAKILRRGGYAFWSDDSWHALILMSGREPGVAESGRRRSTDDENHMVYAEAVYLAEWKNADLFPRSSRFARGDMVRAQDSGVVGQVKDVSVVLGSYQYEVELRGVVKQISEQMLTRVDGNPVLHSQITR